MFFTGNTVNTTLEWAALILLVLLALAVYFGVVWFVQKYASGIVGGFLLMLAGLGLILYPAFYLIRTSADMPQMVVCVAAIFAGCVSVLVGAFSLRDYDDF